MSVLVQLHGRGSAFLGVLAGMVPLGAGEVVVPAAAVPLMRLLLLGVAASCSTAAAATRS